MFRDSWLPAGRDGFKASMDWLPHYKSQWHVIRSRWNTMAKYLELLPEAPYHAHTHKLLASAGKSPTTGARDLTVQSRAHTARAIAGLALGMGAIALQQTAVLPPNKFIWKIVWLHLQLLYPRTSQLGYKVQTIFFCSLRSQHCFVYPHFYSIVALSAIAMISWVRWPITIAPPPKFSVAPIGVVWLRAWWTESILWRVWGGNIP